MSYFFFSVRKVRSDKSGNVAKTGEQVVCSVEFTKSPKKFKFQLAKSCFPYFASMPEGPTLYILKEQTKKFEHHIVQEVRGNAKIDLERLEHKKVTAFKTWGKHFLICFDHFTVKIHFLMFGSYLIDEEKSSQIRLGLTFSNGTLNFYASQVTVLEKPLDEIYDWSADVMNDVWDPKKALKKVKENGSEMICDNLMNQQIFSGVGNIIKNEILFLAGVHPESKTEKIPATRLKKIVGLASDYAFDFMRWKKKHELSRHWNVYHRKKCPVCGGEIIRKDTGKGRRSSFYCTKDQKKYE